MCTWLAKSGENLNVMRLIEVLDLVLKQGWDINEGNWIHFLFSSIWWWFYLSGCCDFCQICQILGWGFLVLHFYSKVCSWFPYLTGPQKDWFGVFCWNLPRFFVIISRGTKNWKKWWVLFFSLLEVFATCSAGIFLAISSKVPILFCHVMF